MKSNSKVKRMVLEMLNYLLDKEMLSYINEYGQCISKNVWWTLKVFRFSFCKVDMFDFLRTHLHFPVKSIHIRN